MSNKSTLFIFVGLTTFLFKLTHAEECDFSCPHGHHKKPSGQSPKVNGCGGQGSIDFNPLFPAFTEICNEHDRCYGKCGVSKDRCDENFSRGMREYCETWQRHSVDFYRDCSALASLYSVGVQAFGCLFYIAAQKQGCTCTRSRSMWLSKIHFPVLYYGEEFFDTLEMSLLVNYLRLWK